MLLGMPRALLNQMHEHLLVGLVTLLALGAFSQLLAYQARVPSILVLLLIGFVAGPVLGVVVPDDILGELTFPFVSLGAALILFEGGLTAHFEELHAHRSAVGRLVTLGLLLTWVFTTISAFWFIGLSLELSALLGAILVVTGPTVIGPILRHARPGGSVGRIAQFEGIINDPLGAILALLVFQVIQVERVETAALLIAWGVVKAALGATLLGIFGALFYAFSRERGWIPPALQNAILMPLVLVVYAASNSVQSEAGLLAVTVMGMVLASYRGIEVEANVEFAEHLRTMLISVLFILLTARITLDDLASLSWGGALFVVTLIVVVRPLVVFLSTLGVPISFKEKVFLSLLAPRGIVAAAVSSVFALRLTENGYRGAEVLLPLTFVVIASCVLVYGLGARPLVKWLGLDDQGRQGVLLLGDDELTAQVAEALGRSGRKAMIISSDRRRVLSLAKRGISAKYGRIQSTALLNRLELAQFGCFLALSTNDDQNTLGCLQFRRVFGKENVAQIALGDASQNTDSRPSIQLRAKSLFGGMNHEDLVHLSEHGSMKVTPITDEFSFEDFVKYYEGRAVPLLALHPRKTPRILNETQPPEPGEEVLSLVWSPAQQESHAA